MNHYDILHSQLLHAIEPISDSDPKRIVDVVLRTLEQQRIISFAKTGDIRLLSVAGRVLVAIMENPDMTQRALGQYLGMSEQHLSRTIKNLHLAGLLVTTKVGSEKTHRLADISALRHPDISRFFDVIAAEIRASFAKTQQPL